MSQSTLHFPLRGLACGTTHPLLYHLYILVMITADTNRTLVLRTQECSTLIRLLKEVGLWPLSWMEPESKQFLNNNAITHGQSTDTHDLFFGDAGSLYELSNEHMRNLKFRKTILVTHAQFKFPKTILDITHAQFKFPKSDPEIINDKPPTNTPFHFCCFHSYSTFKNKPSLCLRL